MSGVGSGGILNEPDEDLDDVRRGGGGYEDGPVAGWRGRPGQRQFFVQRRIDELLQKLHSRDTLIVTELSRLGRSTSEILTLINELIKQKISLIIIKQNVTIMAGTI